MNTCARCGGQIMGDEVITGHGTYHALCLNKFLSGANKILAAIFKDEMPEPEPQHPAAPDPEPDIELDDYEPPAESDERGPFEWMYGHFGSGDPRDFKPDEELCTPEEIERWKADVALAESGLTVIAPPAGQWLYDKTGNLTMHILAPKYGIGMYKLRSEDWL